jgi:hypothetical protein
MVAVRCLTYLHSAVCLLLLLGRRSLNSRQRSAGGGAKHASSAATRSQEQLNKATSVSFDSLIIHSFIKLQIK